MSLSLVLTLGTRHPLGCTAPGWTEWLVEKQCPVGTLVALSCGLQVGTPVLSRLRFLLPVRLPASQPGASAAKGFRPRTSLAWGSVAITPSPEECFPWAPGGPAFAL